MSSAKKDDDAQAMMCAFGDPCKGLKDTEKKACKAEIETAAMCKFKDQLDSYADDTGDYCISSRMRDKRLISSDTTCHRLASQGKCEEKRWEKDMKECCPKTCELVASGACE